jgi:hypothetical protein
MFLNLSLCLSVTLLCGLLLVLDAAQRFLRYLKNRNPPYRRITDILIAKKFLQDSRLEARAKANEPLRDSFDIMNPFISSDKDFHDEYVKCVRIKLSQLDWRDIISHAQDTAAAIPNMITSVKDIRREVRCVVMAIAFNIVGVSSFHYGDLNRVGTLISSLWLGAKNPMIDTAPLRAELYSILGQFKVEDFINDLAELSNVSVKRATLSILIPAYETMYRVVLPLIFHGRNTTFDIFLKPDSSMATLNSRTEFGYSYISLIRETLRLYPVVKRMKRQTAEENVAIDLEAIHRSDEWLDPLEFRPERWMSQVPGGFLPFGAGQGRCIANEYIVGRIVCIVLAVILPGIPLLPDEELAKLLQNDRRQG